MDAQRRYERLLALDGAEMPESVGTPGRNWTRRKVFKHDFFAATGLYEDQGGALGVLKIFRTTHYMGFPFHWLSVFQARHEEKVYLAMQDSAHVPKWFGRVGRYGIMHEFVPGKDMDYAGEPLPHSFFEELRELLRTMHSKGIAYVDTNKPDNILVGEDGRCHLIDFQISWVQPHGLLGILFKPLFEAFKKMDFYHVMKHERKFHPDAISKEALEAMRPWYLRLHRLIADPVRHHRRKLLRKMEGAASKRPEGSESH